MHGRHRLGRQSAASKGGLNEHGGEVQCVRGSSTPKPCSPSVNRKITRRVVHHSSLPPCSLVLLSWQRQRLLLFVLSSFSYQLGKFQVKFVLFAISESSTSQETTFLKVQPSSSKASSKGVHEAKCPNQRTQAHS